MFRTIVHQTIEDINTVAFVEANGPFAVKDIKSSYLGAGYYFWDNHIELAHFWGRIHCKNKYRICQCEIEVQKNDFFDLVGSREDQINFQSIIEKLGLHSLTLGEVIEILKELQIKTKGIFPYKAIRAVDNSKKAKFIQKEYTFKKQAAGFSILSPMYIICLIKKNEVILPPYKVVYPI